MQQSASSRQFRDQIVGRTITGVIARPGRGGEPPVVLMMRFDDGSVVEFVSPRSDRLIRAALTQTQALPAVPGPHSGGIGPQMTLEGLLPTGAVEERALVSPVHRC